MKTYSFSVGPGGVLTCYVVNNGMMKYTGKKAMKLLKHIKELNLFDYAKLSDKNDAGKDVLKYRFSSKTHNVVFNDIEAFKKKNTISIDDELSQLFNIVNRNRIMIEKEEAEARKRFLINFRRAKMAFVTGIMATIMTFAGNFDKNINTITETANNNISITDTIDNNSQYVISETKNIDVEAKTLRNIKNKLLEAKANRLEAEKLNSIKSYKIENLDYTNEYDENENRSKSMSFKADNKVKIEEKVLADECGMTKNNDEKVNTIINNNLYVDHNEAWDGRVLTARAGRIQGPSGEETYYDADVLTSAGMGNCVNTMRNMGFSDVEYPYYLREDGVRMFGNYVMVAANLSIHPRGSLVETSLGTGIVVDTGDFSKCNPYQVDIAVNWTRKKSL